MVFTASLLGAQQNRDSVENKPASLLVASLDKTLNGMPPSLCGRQVVVPSSLPVVVAPVQLRTCKPNMSAEAVYIHLPASCSQQLAQTTKKNLPGARFGKLLSSSGGIPPNIAAAVAGSRPAEAPICCRRAKFISCCCCCSCCCC